MDFQNILASGQELLALYGLKVLGALVVLILGRWVARMLANLLRRGLVRAKADATLTSFIVNVAYVALLVFVVISALGQLGMQTTSFIAVIGAAGLAVGLAFQGSLANFAAGALMTMFRPFRVGDFIEAGGVAGVVEEIQIITTKLRTGDNKTVYVPNNKIMGDSITNYSAKETRRFDAAGISIPYPQRDVHLKGQQAA